MRTRPDWKHGLVLAMCINLPSRSQNLEHHKLVDKIMVIIKKKSTADLCRVDCIKLKMR